VAFPALSRTTRSEARAVVAARNAAVSIVFILVSVGFATADAAARCAVSLTHGARGVALVFVDGFVGPIIRVIKDVGPQLASAPPSKHVIAPTTRRETALPGGVLCCLVALGLCGTLLFRAKSLFVAAIVAAFTGLAPKSANQSMRHQRPS
jgi:hypothetical protein